MKYLKSSLIFNHLLFNRLPRKHNPDIHRLMAHCKKPLTIALCALALTATSFATSTAISIAFPTNLHAQTPDPAASRAKETQADTLVTQQKYKEALPIYEEALTLGSTRPASEQRTLRRKIANTNSRKKEARGDRLLTKNKYKRANSVYRAALKSYEEALTLGSTRPATEKQALQAKIAKAFSLLREKKGDDRMKEGKHGRALALYERALAEGRGRTATELLTMTSKRAEVKGNRAAKRGNFKEAIKSYRESSTFAMNRSQEEQTAIGTKITNTNSKMKEKKGDELAAKGKHAEALKSYQQAASLASARPEAERTALQTKIAIAPARTKEAEGDALVVAGDNAGALTKYQEALAASTSRPQSEKDALQAKIDYVTSVVKEGEGNTHVTNGEHSDALVDFNEALRLGTGRPSGELSALRSKIATASSRVKEAEGDAHVVAGEHSDALTDFNEAARLAATASTLLRRPASELTALQGKIAIATSRIKEAEGDAHVTSGDHSDALVDFNAALSGGTGRPSAELTTLRGKIATATSRVKEAEGDAHVTNNEHSAALVDFREALRLGTGRPSAELTALRGKITTAEAAAAAITYSSLGAIRHWTFDENTGTTARDGINNVQATLVGATFGTGKRGSGEDTGVVFDGTNDAVTFPTISVSGAWSIGMWINSSTTANWKTLISNAGGGRDVVRVRQGNGRVGVSRLGVADAEHGTYTLPTNQWVYLVIVRSGTNVHFYVSGTLRATIANRGFDLSMVVLGASGESASDTSSFGEFFSGSIDDLVVFDKALNTTQIGNLETVAANTVAYAVPEPTNEAPGVIPRLRSWTGGMGSFTLSSSTKLTYSTTDGALSKNSQTQPGLSAQTLAEVATLFTTEILSQESITVTTEAASSLAAGNIHFVLDSTLADVGAEGYTMDIDSDRILITARTSTGAFYATRTLLQFLKISGDQTILVGDVKDYPSYQTRQIMLDAGRKYWTMDFIKDFIRDMSYLKMNSIFMKFMDVDGFRLYSTKAAFKGLANDEVGYNRAEIRELMAFSKKYHVDIMPGFAFPSHAYPVSRHFTIGLRGHCPNPGDPAGWDYVMDMTDPQALTVTNQILREFVPWFTGPYVHTGGDELPGTLARCTHITGYVSRTAAIGHWKDLLFRMTNQMNTTVKALNKTLVIFNGFEHSRTGAQRLHMDTDIAISVWEQSSPISSLSAHKQIIVGTPGELFLTPNEWHALYSNPATIYSSWAPSGASNVLGAGMSVWPDFIKAGDDQYFEDFMLPRRGPMAARLWNRTIPSDTYNDFKADYAKIGRHVHYEGFTEATRVDDGVPNIRLTFDAIDPPFGYTFTNYTVNLWVEDTKNRLAGSTYLAGGEQRDTQGILDGSMNLFSSNDGRAGIGLAGASLKAPWTLTFWYYGRGTRRSRVLLQHRGENRFIRMKNANNRIALDDNGTNYAWTHTPPNNAWTHYAIVAKADGMSDLYVNGTRHSSVNKTIPLPLGSIGRSRDNVEGSLDEMMVFDEALSAAQIVAIRKINQPVSRWAFNEHSTSTREANLAATSATDGAPTAKISLALGGATLKVYNADFDDALRPTGAAPLFDGTNDRATFASTVAVTGAWTIGFWLHPKSVNTAQTLMDFATAATNPFLAITTTGRLSIYGTAFNAYTLTADKWVYLSFVRNGTSVTLYVNGVSQGSVTPTGVGNLAVKYLGARAGTASQFFTGLVDELSVYSGAFTAAEAKMLYNVESPPIERKK